MRDLLYAYFILLLTSTLILLYQLYVFSLTINCGKKQTNKEVMRVKKNHEYVINNNLAQYSAFIIITNQSDVFQVEVLVQLKLKYIKTGSDYYDDKQFVCLIKSPDELQEFPVAYSPDSYYRESKKLICSFRKSDFENSNVHIEDLLVAVIRINDFSMQLGDGDDDLNLTQPVTLPYSFINYQIPTIIQSTQPLLPSIGFCLPFIYKLPETSYTWIDMHLSLGVSEIVIYDGTDDHSLGELMSRRYGDTGKVVTLPYFIEKTDICKRETICRHKCSPRLLKFFEESCEEYYESEFKHKVYRFYLHNQITWNSCFTMLSKKYEFVGVGVDLDEFVYPPPPHYNTTTGDSPLLCNSKQLCNMQTYTIKGQYYDYLKQLIEQNAGKRDPDRLASIEFQHAIYIKPDDAEKKLMADLSNIIETTTAKFPTQVFLSEPPHTSGQIFKIEAHDIEYVKHLYRSYTCNNFTSYLHSLSGKLDQDLLRYTYFTTGPRQRMGKCIHYSKNIRSVFAHYAQEAEKDTWSFQVSAEEGHFLKHFRKNVAEVLLYNFTSSIRDLKIDFTYLSFLLKNYTPYCSS